MIEIGEKRVGWREGTGIIEDGERFGQGSTWGQVMVEELIAHHGVIDGRKMAGEGWLVVMIEVEGVGREGGMLGDWGGIEMVGWGIVVEWALRRMIGRRMVAEMFRRGWGKQWFSVRFEGAMIGFGRRCWAGGLGAEEGG